MRKRAAQRFRIPCRPGTEIDSQRDKILKEFVDAGRHVSAEELYAAIRKTHPRIGYATVYRTLETAGRGWDG